ncbi:MAG: TatD family hydrolase [Planctomycetota bacterium]
MFYFDPHIHMTSRTTDDYEAMAKAGIRAIVEPAFWLGQPRQHKGTFVDYFNSLVGWERFRASQFGIRHFCTIGLNSKEANNEPLAREVMELLPHYLCKEGVVGLGEIGFDEMSPLEERFFMEQLVLAKKLGLIVQIHTPHRDKKRGTLRSLDLVREAGLEPGRVLVDHNNEETVRATLEAGCWAGHTIYPRTKMDSDRMEKIVKDVGHERVIINSSADWGLSDPLSVVKTADLMRKRCHAESDIEKIFWLNPVEFFSQSGELSRADLERSGSAAAGADYEGNTVLRGQTSI